MRLTVNRVPVRFVRSLANRALGRSDYTMWSDPSNLNPDWNERTRLLAGLVPAEARVIEFGAGRRELERHLPPGSSYVPSDLVDRGAGTVVLDLNDPDKPDLRHLDADVAVFGGTLEYVRDLRALVDWLASHVCDRCVCSYAAARSRRGTLARARESILRARDGWVNSYSERELLELFGNSGFRGEKQAEWRGQSLFVFERERTAEADSETRP
jgi:hypothetical protein